MSVMKRILRGLPRLRNAMLLGLASLAARILDDSPEVLMPPPSARRPALHLAKHHAGVPPPEKKPVLAHLSSFMQLTLVPACSTQTLCPALKAKASGV